MISSNSTKNITMVVIYVRYRLLSCLFYIYILFCSGIWTVQTCSLHFVLHTVYYLLFHKVFFHLILAGKFLWDFTCEKSFGVLHRFLVVAWHSGHVQMYAGCFQTIPCFWPRLIPWGFSTLISCASPMGSRFSR